MNFLSKLAGIGLVAAAAVLAVRLIEKFCPDTQETELEYTAVAGDFPDDVCDALDAAFAGQADGESPEQADAPPAQQSAPPQAQDAAPNRNPVDAPPAAPQTDPLKIADPADFQDWDGLGCQG